MFVVLKGIINRFRKSSVTKPPHPGTAAKTPVSTRKPKSREFRGSPEFKERLESMRKVHDKNLEKIRGEDRAKLNSLYTDLVNTPEIHPDLRLKESAVDRLVQTSGIGETYKFVHWKRNPQAVCTFVNNAGPNGPEKVGELLNIIGFEKTGKFMHFPYPAGKLLGTAGPEQVKEIINVVGTDEVNEVLSKGMDPRANYVMLRSAVRKKQSVQGK